MSRQPALLSDAQGAVIVCPGDRTPGVRCAGALDLRDELALVCGGGQEYSVVHEVPHLAWGDRQPPNYARLGYLTYHDHHFAGFTEPPESSDAPADDTLWHQVSAAHAPSEVFYRGMTELIAPFVPDAGLALDVGCKLGRMAAEMSAGGAERTLGVDINARALEEADRILFDPSGRTRSSPRRGGRWLRAAGWWCRTRSTIRRSTRSRACATTSLSSYMLTTSKGRLTGR